MKLFLLLFYLISFNLRSEFIDFSNTGPLVLRRDSISLETESLLSSALPASQEEYSYQIHVIGCLSDMISGQLSEGIVFFQPKKFPGEDFLMEKCQFYRSEGIDEICIDKLPELCGKEIPAVMLSKKVWMIQEPAKLFYSFDTQGSHNLYFKFLEMVLGIIDY